MIMVKTAMMSIVVLGFIFPFYAIALTPVCVPVLMIQRFIVRHVRLICAPGRCNLNLVVVSLSRRGQIR